jgi:hypothetical protein
MQTQKLVLSPITIGTLLGILCWVYMSSASINIAAEARTESYDAPCNAGDWEKNGGCCPSDTEYLVHNDCMTEDEYQQRQEANSEIGKCVIGRTIEGVITGDAETAAGGFSCLVK